MTRHKRANTFDQEGKKITVHQSVKFILTLYMCVCLTRKDREREMFPPFKSYGPLLTICKINYICMYVCVWKILLSYSAKGGRGTWERNSKSRQDFDHQAGQSATP